MYVLSAGNSGRLALREEEMAVFCVELHDVKRRFDLPFQLDSVGFIENHPYQSVAIKGVLELCIRLSSTAHASREIFGNQRYTVRYPNAALKVPDILHAFTVDHPRDAVYFKYNPSLVGKMRKAGLIEPPYCWDLHMNPEINLILRETRGLMSEVRKYGVADRLDMLAMRLFEEVLLQRGAPLHQDSEYMDAKIQKIASHFQLNFCRGIDLDALIREHGMSRRNFFRHWKRCFNITPAGYIWNLKLAEGARLLRDTGIPIWKISETLQFKNPSYFCMIFRERFGLTPLQFRKVKSQNILDEKYSDLHSRRGH